MPLQCLNSNVWPIPVTPPGDPTDLAKQFYYRMNSWIWFILALLTKVLYNG